MANAAWWWPDGAAEGKGAGGRLPFMHCLVVWDAFWSGADGGGAGGRFFLGTRGELGVPDPPMRNFIELPCLLGSCGRRNVMQEKLDREE